MMMSSKEGWQLRMELCMAELNPFRVQDFQNGSLCPNSAAQLQTVKEQHQWGYRCMLSEGGEIF